MSSPLEVSRRNVLQIMGVTSVGVLGAGALASCSPGTADDPKATTSNGSAGPGGTGGGEIHIGWPYTAPPEGNFNMYGTAGIVDTSGVPYGELMHMPSANYLWASGEWVKHLIDDNKLDEAANTYTMTIKKGLTWSDGAPITAKDYETTFYCQWLLGQPVWAYVKSIEVKDDQTFVLHLDSPSTVLERYILKAKIADSQTYGDIAGKAAALQKAGKKRDDTEGAALLTELQKMQPKTVVTSGPYIIDQASVTNTQLTMVKNPSGYQADKVKFDTIVVYNGETPEVTPLVQSKTVDYATHGFPPSTEKAFESAGIRIVRSPNMSGPALVLNFDKVPEFKDKRVRQAIAHVIDRAVNGKVSLAASGVGVEYMAGFGDNLLDDWLPAGVKDTLKTYPKDDAAAETLLKQAGWTRQGSKWMKPDGKPAAWEVMFPAQFADSSAAGKNVAEQLNAFGFSITPRGVDHAQAPIDVDKGNFQMSILGWGASTQPHPYFAFDADLHLHNIPIAKNNGGRGMGYELESVPAPGGGTVNLDQLITDCGKGLDIEKQKAAIGTIAQVFNEELPLIPLFERFSNNPCLEGVRVKAFPKEGSPVLANPAYADNFVMLSLLDGTLEPVAK